MQRCPCWCRAASKFHAASFLPHGEGIPERDGDCVAGVLCGARVGGRRERRCPSGRLELARGRPRSTGTIERNGERERIGLRNFYRLVHRGIADARGRQKKAWETA